MSFWSFFLVNRRLGRRIRFALGWPVACRSVRWALAACLLVPGSSSVCGQGAAPRVGLVDAQTQWEFVADEEAMSESSIIRLGDVLRPLQRDLAAWPRLSAATVGLMPIDGSAAKLSRDRLAQLIAQAQATPEKIKIHGPAIIRVTRGNGEAKPPAPDDVAPVSYQQSSARPALPSPESGRLHVAPDASPTPVTDPETYQRIQQWVELGLQREHRELLSQFDLAVRLGSQSLGTLEQLQGIRELAFLDPVPRWTREIAVAGAPISSRLRIVGRGDGEPCQGVVTLELTPHRAVVSAARSFGRGHRVRPGDVTWQAAPADASATEATPPLQGDETAMRSDEVTAPEEIIGMESTGVIRQGVPLLRSQFIAPRLVRRGDLLEVQVTGGGVCVTTSAKSLSDGAAGELIEIETLQPRRKLLARVVDSFLVEIATQPTRIEPTP